jgi:hypothetical protein
VTSHVQMGLVMSHSVSLCFKVFGTQQVAQRSVSVSRILFSPIFLCIMSCTTRHHSECTVAGKKGTARFSHVYSQLSCGCFCVALDASVL